MNPILVILVLISFLTTAADYKSDKLSKNDNLQLSLKTGDFLRSDYVHALMKTRSSLKAEKLNEPQCIKVTKQKNGLQLMAIYNFHEGGETFLLKGDGTLKTDADAGNNVSNLSIKIIDHSRFTISYGNHRDMTFQFVENAEKWVASIVLVGKYRDNNGRLYTFADNGEAIFDGKKFMYAMGLDHVFTKFEYFYGENYFYAFRMTNDTLEIYGTHGEMNEFISKKPKWRLKRFKQ